MSDDFTGEYLATRGNANPSPADQRRARLASEDKPEPETEFNLLSTAGSVAKDVAGGVIEAPRQVLGGARDAVQETIELAGSLGEWLNENVADLGDLSDLGIGAEGEEFTLPDVDEPRTTTGGLVRGIAQFLTGFAGGAKALKGVEATTTAARIGKAAGIGAIADATVFDAHEDRLSNLVQEFPALENPISEYLAAKPDDTEVEGRFKNALEGLGLGAITEGAMFAFKGMRASRIAKAQERELIEAQNTAKTLTDKAEEFKPFDEMADEAASVDLTPKADLLPNQPEGSRVLNTGKKQVFVETADGQIMSFNKNTNEWADVTNLPRGANAKAADLKASQVADDLPTVTDEWFEGSKIVDDSGEALTVYHGTPVKAGDDFVFDASKIGTQGRSEGAGFYFTDDKKVAQGYTRESGTLLEVNLNIKQPMTFDQQAFEFDDMRSIIKELAEIEAKEFNAGIGDGFLSNFGDVNSQGLDNVLDDAARMLGVEDRALDQMGGIVGSGADPVMVNRAVQAVTGFDGVISKGFSGEGKAGGTIYTAFFPEQVRVKPKAETPKPAQAGAQIADPERAKNINLNRLETTDDVKSLIDDIAEAESGKINEARREIITNEETAKLADDLGMTVDNLLKRRKGDAFNAEQAVAARQLLVASGENLFKLAKTAATGSDAEVALFRRALSQHSAIQSQVSGLTAEAGRALQSFRIHAQSAAGQERAIKEALEAGGGTEFSKDMASRISQLGNINQLNIMVKQSLGAKTNDMLYEAWINGLLSNPATHAVNVMSNALVAAWTIGERKVASLIGNARGNAAIPEGEATAQLKGMIEGSKDGFKLAWHVMKTGDVTDPLQKIENQKYRSITSENLNLTGTAGQFADYFGEFVRLPGRSLMAGDELFKTIGYRMELNAQAFRTATSEGLEGEDFAKRVVDIVNNPPENLHLAAIDVGRYQTFTKELGEAGKAVQGVRSKVPGARVIAPFIRTPVNIAKYIGERTPLAPLSKNVRSEISAGGARKDLMLAKIATGSMVMATAADYALSGDVTGSGPKNADMRNILRATGWQPYSIKVGDNYYAYSRLDPIGGLIGLAADISEISGQSDEFDAFDMTAAAVVSVAQNMSSKTYLRGVTEAFDVFSSTSSDPNANNEKAKRWISRLAGTVVPSGVAAVERIYNPELTQANGIIDQIKSRLPGYSDDLPPRRNIFGEVIVLQGGLGPDIVSPIYQSTDKKDPIADEIVAQQTSLGMPSKTIKGVRLTAEEYDRYIILYSGKDNKFTKGVDLKRRLKDLFRTPQYKKATDGQEGAKSLMIKSVFQMYQETAKAQMIQEFPRIGDDIIAKKRKKAKSLTGRDL